MAGRKGVFQTFHTRLENSAVGIGSTGCARWHGSRPSEIFTRSQVCCSRNMYSETQVSAARADHRPNPKTGPVHLQHITSSYWHSAVTFSWPFRPGLGTSRQAFAEAIPLRCWNLFDGFRQVRAGVPEFRDALSRNSPQPGTLTGTRGPVFQSASDAQRHALQPRPGRDRRDRLPQHTERKRACVCSVVQRTSGRQQARC